MDCTVTPLKTLMGFSVHLNVQLKFYNLPNKKSDIGIECNISISTPDIVEPILQSAFLIKFGYN